MSAKSTETTIHGGFPDNGYPPGRSDRGIADPMATAGLQLGYGGESLATGSVVTVWALSRLRTSNKTLSARCIILITKDRVLDTWKHIQEAEAKEDVLLDKIQKNLDKMDAVISPACNIQKSINENFLTILVENSPFLLAYLNRNARIRPLLRAI